ncbi:MAG: PAS domain S-box protein [Spirochaetes bacterium]|jgi:PAS domain S-box-containing protein|nr:PAS domain S-box protein [Spirochaetota bacterium]
MEDEKLESITARLKAINKIPYLLDTIDTEKWDFTAICRIFVDTIGYKSCWMALIDDKGQTSDFFLYKSDAIFDGNPGVFTRSNFDGFVREALIHPGDTIMNRDPLLDFIAVVKGTRQTLNSVTIKLSYHGIIYGVLSVTLAGGYQDIKEEFLIISDVVKTVSYFLYDMESKNKIKDLFLTMFETTGNATAIFEEDTTISYANKEFENLSGYSKDEIEGRMSFTDFVESDDARRMLAYHRLRRTDPSNAPRNYEFRFIDRAGAVKDIYMTIDIVPRSKTSIASFRNITDKKRLESEILRISEQERQQIGNELHDNLGPHLVGTKFLLKVLKQKIEGGTMPDFNEVEEIDRLITQAIDQTRTMIKGLKPVDIQSDGLIFALEDLASKVSSIYGKSCRLVYDESFSIDNNITATHLYYIVNEAVNNALKHGMPENIEINLTDDGGAMSVEITDDGSGYRAGEGDGGMGIGIMKYRASIINSSFEIRRNRSGGTTVTCRLTA